MQCPTIHIMFITQFFSALFPLYSVALAHDLVDKPVMAQYYPTYASEILPVSNISWNYVDLMIYFVCDTNSTGFAYSEDPNLALLVSEGKKNNIPVTFSIGGWDGSIYFSGLVSTSELRGVFIQQISDFIANNNLSGVDIDWEFPNSSGVGCNNYSPVDVGNLLQFFMELRQTLGEDKLITAAVGVQGWSNPDGIDISQFGDYLDYITIMNYDVFNGLMNITGPNSPLDIECVTIPNVTYSATSAVGLWTDQGFPREKILLGVPSYGHSFTTLSSTLTADNGSLLFQNKTAGAPEGDLTDSEGDNVCGVYDGWGGDWLYRSLINYGFLSSNETEGLNGFTKYYDACSSTPFLFNPSNRTLISYDDSNSTSLKATWAIEQGLAGINIFDATGFPDSVLEVVQASLKSAKPVSTSSLPSSTNQVVPTGSTSASEAASGTLKNQKRMSSIPLIAFSLMFGILACP